MPARPCTLPDDALLRKYCSAGAYTDCYSTTVPGEVSFARYVTAFYTTPVFRLERWILDWAVNKPSTDDEAGAVAAGERDSFAAWQVEARAPKQLLLCDFRGRTRSWLMTEPLSPTGARGTRLYFGSAVVPAGRSTGFGLLLGFHRLYSRILLNAARRACNST